MATMYVSGDIRTDNFYLACFLARSVSGESYYDTRVYLRNPRLSRDVLVAAYRGGRPVTVSDVPRDTVLRTLRERVGNIVI